MKFVEEDIIYRGESFCNMPVEFLIGGLNKVASSPPVLFRWGVVGCCCAGLMAAEDDRFMPIGGGTGAVGSLMVLDRRTEGLVAM